jgi:hypothetical protein
MHANQFKLELGLYLAACGAPHTAIDALSNAGISVTYKTVYNTKKKDCCRTPIKGEKVLHSKCKSLV